MKPSVNKSRNNSRKGQRQKNTSIETGRPEHIGRLLLYAFRYFERMVLKSLKDAGYADLRMSHLIVIRNISGSGTRISEIAETEGMAKQAVSILAHELEEMGYTVRISDPTDRRAKLENFSRKGMTLVRQLPSVLRSAEDSIVTLLGAKEFRALRDALRHIVSSPEPEGSRRSAAVTDWPQATRRVEERSEQRSVLTARTRSPR